MENLNHLNSDYYSLPSFSKSRKRDNSEFTSTLAAIAVVAFFTIIALIVC